MKDPYYKNSKIAKEKLRLFLKKYKVRNPSIDSIAILGGLKRVLEEAYDEQIVLFNSQKAKG